MTVEYHTLSKPHRDKNDDIAGFEGDTYWLMDGSTQLVAPDHGLDATWHVNRLDRAFRDILKSVPDIELHLLARAAIDVVAAEFFERTGLTIDAPQHLRPFSTLLLCRINLVRTRLEYLIICDSVLVVVHSESEKAIIGYHTNTLEPIYAVLRQSHGFESKLFKETMDGLYRQEADIINKPNGFDVVGQDSAVVERALTGHIDLRPDSHILLMSDGFTRILDTLHLYSSWRSVLEALKGKGPAQIFQDLRAVEAKDAQGTNYPRSSRHDDATLLWIKPS